MNLKELEDQVRALMAQGRKVEAVKRVLKTTGWGLKESKDYVDALGEVVQEVGRNDPCPCGSGRKYKHCCGKKH
jgi:preprotein translocase subunit SecA